MGIIYRASLETGSGRNHNQITTINMVKSVKTLTAKGAVVNSINTPLNNIIMEAIHLALRGTVPFSRQARNVAPCFG